MMPAARKSAEVSLRTAREGDAASIATLATELGYPSTEAEILKRLQRIQTRNEGSAIVAELGSGGVCGWITVASVNSLTGPARAEVAGLIVAQSLRGMGVGSLLLQAALSWARINGYAEVRVHSNTSRQRAHQFYEREGFDRVKTQALFRKLT
jgi:predicted N-acetyltransferase YhbS